MDAQEKRWFLNNHPPDISMADTLIAPTRVPSNKRGEDIKKVYMDIS
jgi:hypothetical protein